MSQFKVSVIIPVYNAEKFISDAVNSVKELDEVGEILLIDDGSTDNSVSLCSQLASENSLVKFYRHNDKKNNGIAATRNLGIRKSSFDYISFLDADDLYLPNRFETDKSIFDNKPETEVVYGCCKNVFLTIKGEEEYKKRHVYRPDVLYTIFKRVSSKEIFSVLIYGEDGQIHTNAITIKKTAFEKIGLFNESLKMSEDTEMWFKLSIKTIMLPGSIDDPVALRRMHDNNITNSDSDRKYFLNKMFDSFFRWSLNHKIKFSDLHKIFSVLKWQMKGYQCSDKKFFWIYFVSNPSIILHVFFWKKLHLMYLVKK